jgi:CubicO group peptidase (beta-lactamase class C family)
MNRQYTQGSLAIFVACLALSGDLARTNAKTSLNMAADPHQLVAGLDQAIPDLMEEAGIPGLSIAVIHDGELLWSGAYGVKNTRTGEPVDENTIFEAASLTKPFFAYLVMKMVERGEIDLDRPLVEYASQEYIEQGYISHSMDREDFRSDWFKQITARMVLSHSGGLPHGERHDPLPIAFEPGTDYKYSAGGYFYLQRIVEHLRGENLEEIMQKELIQPLGMYRSSLVWQERYETNTAVGHNLVGWTNGRPRRRREPHAAATLYTTATDYARFVAAVLNETGLSHATVFEMLSQQIENEEGVSWSLGFGLDYSDQGEAFWQWGDYGIFRNYILAYKEHGTGVVYLTNSFNGLSIRDEIIRLVFGADKHSAFSWPRYAQYDHADVRLARIAVTESADKAADFYHESKAQDPESLDGETVAAYGRYLLNAYAPDAAVVLFKLNVEAYPESSDAYYDLARGYLYMGDFGAAIANFRESTELRPERRDAPVRMGFSRLMHSVFEHGTNAALRHLGDLEESYPDQPFEAFINSYGYSLMGQDRIEDAIRVFKFDVTAYAESWNVYDSLGEAYMETGDTELAIKFYRKSIELNPDNTNGLNILKTLESKPN